MPIRIKAALLLFLAAAWGCTHARALPEEAGEVIEVEGWAPVDPQDPVGTRQRALVMAQKSAVERVVGVYVSAKTRVDAAVVVDQKILARVDGYVRRYDVLDEKEEAGIRKVRIRAFILHGKLGEDLRSAGLSQSGPVPGNPRVSVRILDRSGKSPNLERAASGAIRRQLVERGFTVIEEGEESAARADLVVSGEVQVSEIVDERLRGFHSSRARLRAQVKQRETGAVLAEKTQEASAMDVAAPVADDKAVDTAGQMLAEMLIAELAGRLRALGSLLVRVHGARGLLEVERIVEGLRTLPEASAVTLLEYRNGVAEMSVSAAGISSEELAAIWVKTKKPPLALRSLSPYVLELETVP
ncbi:MAG: hypothetical protein HY551_03920 [Elusimicrobia bacterium]|nr:hypothetical protein [Elusimicrobiota bacterium]